MKNVGCITLDAALEEGFAALAGPDAVVVSRGVVAAHCAVSDLLHQPDRPRSSRRPRRTRGPHRGVHFLPAGGAAQLHSGSCTGQHTGPAKIIFNNYMK